MLRAHVEEVDSESVDLGAILREAVEGLLTSPPVVARPPIVHEGAKLGERRALRPVVGRLTFRPARARQTLFQVVERALRRMIGEGCDGGRLGERLPRA